MIAGDNFNMVDLYQEENLPRVTLAKRQDEFILGQMPAGDSYGRKAEEPFLTRLATRELEILGLLAQGHTNLATARMLRIDNKTVEYHLSNMRRKLGDLTDFNKRERYPGVNMSGPDLKKIGEPITSGSLVMRLAPCLFN